MAAACHTDKEVYISGGRNYHRAWDNIHMYEHATDSWTFLGHMCEPRYNHVNVLLIWVVKNEDQELGAHAVIAAPAGSEYKDAMQYIQVFKNIRNSPPYLERIGKDIRAMIRQLGIPTWFMLDRVSIHYPLMKISFFEH